MAVLPINEKQFFYDECVKNLKYRCSGVDAEAICDAINPYSDVQPDNYSPILDDGMYDRNEMAERTARDITSYISRPDVLNCSNGVVGSGITNALERVKAAQRQSNNFANIPSNSIVDKFNALSNQEKILVCVGALAIGALACYGAGMIIRAAFVAPRLGAATAAGETIAATADDLIRLAA